MPLVKYAGLTMSNRCGKLSPMVGEPQTALSSDSGRFSLGVLIRDIGIIIFISLPEGTNKPHEHTTTSTQGASLGSIRYSLYGSCGPARKNGHR